MLSLALDEHGFPTLPPADLVAKASETPILDDASVQRLAQEALRSAVARRALLEAHLRVAVDEAIRHRGLGTRQDELIRVGARALAECVVSYDPGRHGPFRAFVTRAVRRAIGDVLAS